MHQNSKKLIALIGSMKSGTSNLYSLLATHPQIDGGLNKEGNYFANNDLDGFSRNFVKTNSTYLLDGSTAYTKPGLNKISAFNIHKAKGEIFSEVFILYIVRDPIDGQQPPMGKAKL